ncbi:DUF4878 domain-containing protein [Flavobacteriaceae bacterium F08102]|nr:DUF4878 domain-containing protein [Flavobacteriaceae bacterium F08102]
MNIKKQLGRLVLVAFLLLTFSCSKNTPAAAAEAFLSHLYAGEFNEAKEFSTTDTKSVLSMMESFGAKDQMEDMLVDATFNVIETTMDGGDKATVKVQVNDNDGNEEIQSLSLVKKDGKWLVNMGKEDSPKEGLKPSTSEE